MTFVIIFLAWLLLGLLVAIPLGKMIASRDDE